MPVLQPLSGVRDNALLVTWVLWLRKPERSGPERWRGMDMGLELKAPRTTQFLVVLQRILWGLRSSKLDCNGWTMVQSTGRRSVFDDFFFCFPFSESEQHDFSRWFQLVSIFGMSGSATNLSELI